MITMKKYNDELKLQKEELVKKNEDFKNEATLSKEKMEDLDEIKSKYIEKYETAKKKLQVKNLLIILDSMFLRCNKI